jgi:hypothetical protein
MSHDVHTLQDTVSVSVLHREVGEIEHILHRKKHEYPSFTMRDMMMLLCDARKAWKAQCVETRDVTTSFPMQVDLT